MNIKRVALITTTCLAGLAGLAVLIPGCVSSFGQPPTATDIERLKNSSNFSAEDETFINPIKTSNGFQSSPLEMASRMLNSPDATPPNRIPVVPQPEGAYDQAWPDGVRITWVGHATVLVEIDGFRILTDPIWSERCSPFSFAGPKRFHKPGIPLHKLPKLDAVIISHDHYDHLDEPTIHELAKRKTPFYVPLGVGSHFSRWGIKGVKELDWWDQVELTNERGQTLKLGPTPARHFSGRSITDRNHTQWASWAIIGPKSRVYFGGDTGYFPGFKEIGERLGPFDLTIMPIGAYDRAWSQIHLNPEEAVQAHKDVKGKVMMPIHWGTFDLALHTWRDPMLRLTKASRIEGVAFVSPLPGELVEIGEHAKSSAVEPSTWWSSAEAANNLK